MRLEIVIPDSTPPELKARLANLTQRLSAQPELVEGINLDANDEAAIQRMFTPERLAHIDVALAEVEAGQFFTMEQVDEHFRKKAAAWTQSHSHWSSSTRQ